MTTTSKVVALSLPFDPMPSPRPRVVVRGKFPSVYMPKDYMEWKAGVAAYVHDRMTEFPVPVSEGPVEVSLVFHVERPKTTKLWGPKPDIDNYAKSVLDAFNDSGVVWKDDCQVVRLVASKQWADGTASISAEITYVKP